MSIEGMNSGCLNKHSETHPYYVQRFQESLITHDNTVDVYSVTKKTVPRLRMTTWNSFVASSSYSRSVQTKWTMNYR